MKLFAHHDAAGTIRSLVFSNAPAGITLTLAPRPGELVSEIDGHGLSAASTEKELRALARAHLVADPIPRRTLVKKK